MDFSHINEQGRAKMVDVTDKEITCREAAASCIVKVNAATMELIKSGVKALIQIRSGRESSISMPGMCMVFRMEK